jgi:hypothetical protein
VGGLTYNPTYSQSDIDAIRRYNRDVASGRSNWWGITGALTGGARGLMTGGRKGALIGAGLGLLAGKGIGYMGERLNQGFNNYMYTDVNSQDRR